MSLLQLKIVVHVQHLVLRNYSKCYQRRRRSYIGRYGGNFLSDAGISQI